MTEPGPQPLGARRVWALLLVPFVLGLQWYIGRPDLVGVFGRRDWTVVTPAALGPVPSFVAAFVLLGILPGVLAVTAFGWRPRALGLGLGRRRRGLTLTAVGLPLAILAGWIGSRSGALAAIYPLGLDPGAPLATFALYAGAYLLYYTGFEFFFRGYLLSGVGTPLGPVAANALQAVLATLVHFGRPAAEFAAAFPASLVFGWVALRTGSIWYGVVLHWVVGVSLDWFVR